MLGEKHHQENRIRFEPTRLSRAWASVRKHLTPPTHPSTTSESALGSGMYAETDMFGYDDARAGAGGGLPLEVIDPVAARARKRGAAGAGGGGGVVGSLLKNRKGGGGGTAGDSSKRGLTSAHQSGSRYEGDDDEGPWEPVSTVVVDNDFEQVIPLAARSDSGSTRTPGGKEGSSLFPGTNQSEKRGDEGGARQRRGSATLSEIDGGDGAGGGTTTAKRDEDQRNWVQRTATYELVMVTVWPSVKYFFDSRYIDPQKEYAFMRETWFQTKMGAMASAVFFLISWALSTGLQPVFSPFIWITYMGLGGLFTIPLIALIAFDFPRRQNWIWQPMLLGASWVLADVLIVEAYRCGFFSTNNTCGRKNFLNMLGFAFGQPVLALLAMRQNRLFATIGAGQWLILAGALLMTQNNSPTLFYRNMVNFALFHAFIIGTSFLRERGDRHMFEMRQQLKMQFRATQSAQVMERKASDSKRRFVSYIFHEVRVPLNTALLAVQNLEGENVFRHVQADQGEMVHGLVRSLTTMEKVLNDVLSFNRMEAGKFTQARKPFDFHKSINLVALSHRPQAMSAGIELAVELDPEIDALGSGSGGLSGQATPGGIFIGDEMRLRQITSNLVSNSIKFTESGSVRIVTKLIYPRLDLNAAAEAGELDTPLREAAENLHHLQQQAQEQQQRASMDIEKGSIHLESLRHATDPKHRDSTHADVNKERDRERRKAIVRVEIHDTGIGLKKDDLDDQRLFSPYVQTEIGRRQGGKGSGLGLALVRQIVRLSSGRLGVDSEFGKGSVFWFELPYALPSASASRSRTPGSGGGGARDTPTSPRMGTLPPALAVPTIDEESAGATPFDDGKEDPLDAIENRDTNVHSTVPNLSKYQHQHQHASGARPRMSETESTIPLLSPTDSNRKDSVPTTEEVIMTTYPPPDSGSSADSASQFDHTEAAIVAMQQQQRRESEWTAESSSVAAGSRRASEATSPPATGEGQGDPPLCAFVVDDDRLTRMLMSRMLTRLGHQVTTAENGKIALEMIKDSYAGKPGIPKFDVCFLDNQMPFMSGVEVVRALREMGNPLYVVGCTGNALREDQDEYLSAGADDIIPKPIHQKSVLEQIKHARKRVAGETKPKAIQSMY